MEREEFGRFIGDIMAKLVASNDSAWHVLGEEGQAEVLERILNVASNDPATLQTLAGWCGVPDNQSEGALGMVVGLLWGWVLGAAEGAIARRRLAIVCQCLFSVRPS